MFELEVSESVSYLQSRIALESLAFDAYWPKWNSPWWHMSLLREMGLAREIPSVALEALIASVRSGYLPVLSEAEAGAQLIPGKKIPCACELGNLYQTLSAAGVNVDTELPWIRPWFLRYQMPDGGLSCDPDAYLVDPPASSMVATIAPLEAVLLCTNRAFSPAEIDFLDRGAKFLMDRELRLGSRTQYNAEEREDEADWLKLCFPRFYFYDVLRGLNFLNRWAEKLSRVIPTQSVHAVHESLQTQIVIGRECFETVRSKVRTPADTWMWGGEATLFPLLKTVSRVGSGSPFLDAEWNSACKGH